MKIIKLPSLGLFEVNGYLVISEKGSAALIDAPPNAEEIVRIAAENGAVIKKILVTHGHFDHIQGLKALADLTGAEVYVHELDAPKLADPRQNLSAMGFEPVESYSGATAVTDGELITLDELTFRVLHTPGHTSGGACYIVGDVIFSGDTLFYQSIGRTDLPDGDSAVLARSLKKLAAFEGEYGDFKIMAGHGDDSSLSFERQNNPYLES